jgi:hypothetical protein
MLEPRPGGHTVAMPPEHFSADLVEGLDEPVRRHLAHALEPDAPLHEAVTLTMTGQIRAGRWLPFTATQRCALRAFEWRARIGLGPLTVLAVVDRYALGQGATDIRLLGRLRVSHAAGEDTTRSAAGRAALEAAVFLPGALMARNGVRPRAEADDLLVADWDVAPEHPEVHVRIDEHGAIRAVSALRWHGADHGYVPCGAEVHAERRFGAWTIPSRLTVGWGFGTPAWAPFFRAEVTSLSPA